MMALRGNKGSGNIVERDLWQTPEELFYDLNYQYKFIFDCCANKENRKHLWFSNNFETIDKEYFKIIDGIAWMNPPFSKASKMFEHFFKVVLKGVCIFRCDNMETKLWQNIILKNATWILIPNKRINYEGMNGNGAVFPSALIGYNVDIPKNIDGTILYPNHIFLSQNKNKNTFDNC
ncbi:MAG: DNA N-6-adenine-methyltransferase [archaeon]